MLVTPLNWLITFLAPLSGVQQPIDLETVVRVMPKRKPSKEAIQEVKRKLSMKLIGQGDVSM